MRRLLTAALVSAAVAACGGESTAPTVSVARVVITPSTIPDLTPGETVQLTAQAFGEDDQLLPTVTFAWGTSRSSVATVEEGLVTAVAPGFASIAATAGGRREQVSVDVVTATAE